ncbi:MAG: hypothetical protein AB1547_01685 [Thermodesulfobacteriota bacterium]
MIPLCQTPKSACAACCGLYNAADNSRTDLQKLLADRTARFAGILRCPEAIEDFGSREIERSFHTAPPPLPHFHHCPYIGFIDEAHRKPGCLLHPQVPANAGIDWRDLCHYGGFACRTYYCPSHESVSNRMHDLLQTAIDDWYAYGMIITRRHLLAFLEERLFSETRDIPLAATDRIDIVRKAAALVVDWPYRRNPVRDRIHYFFNDAPEQPIASSRTLEAWMKSPESDIRWIDRFREIGSTFGTAVQMADAVYRWRALTSKP